METTREYDLNYVNRSIASLNMYIILYIKSLHLGNGVF